MIASAAQITQTGLALPAKVFFTALIVLFFLILISKAERHSKLDMKKHHELLGFLFIISVNVIVISAIWWVWS